MPGLTFGSLGVCIFFSISGYLVTQSWLRDPHALRFASRRILRIWPGLAATVCFCALVIGPIVTTAPLLDYFRAPEMHGYFALLRLGMRFDLPGVFLDTPYPRVLNGSLWTIPLEISCYLALLGAGLLRVLNFRWLSLAIFAGLAVHFFGMDPATVKIIPYYRLEYGLFFGFGACLWLFRDYWQARRAGGAALMLVGFAVAICLHEYTIACLLTVPYTCVVCGAASTPVLRRCGRFGDFSYGMYIYAFPVQQTLIWASHARWPLMAYLASSVTATLLLAYGSWHLLEAPALRLKPRA